MKKTNKDIRIKNATADYYGKGASSEEKSRIETIARFITGRNYGIKLTEEEMSAVMSIKGNMTDAIYMSSF